MSITPGVAAIGALAAGWIELIFDLWDITVLILLIQSSLNHVHFAVFTSRENAFPRQYRFGNNNSFPLIQRQKRSDRVNKQAIFRRT